MSLFRSLTVRELQDELQLRYITLADDGAVHVEIIGPEGALAVTGDLVESFGGELESTWRHRAEAWVPAEQLSALALALPDGYYMERADVAGLDEVIGEGPDVINSDSYSNNAFDGAGRVIAIIDSGFQNLTAARNNGDAPAAADTTEINYTLTGFQATTEHGTGCVEAAFDHSPGATWRLYKTDSVTDLGNAVDNAIDNGVDIISHSIRRYNQGWFDNSGGACAAANEAGQNGIIFFTSAGNRGDSHWGGDFESGDGHSDWHDFSLGDETINIIMADGEGANFYMSWDISGGTYDYDLYAYDSADPPNVLASSTNGGNNYESFGFTNNTGSAKIIRLAVWRDSGGVTTFELFAHGGGTWQEHIVAAGSTTSPSNSTHFNVVSVGAVDWNDYSSPPGTHGIIEDYSSRGPSNSGLTLPDICGPTNTTGLTYSGGFGGTSCATPNNAGATCAFWSAYPQLSASAIRWLMLRQASIYKDWGGGGTDNTYGRGGASLIDYFANTTWVARAYGNINDTTAGPYYRVDPAHEAAVPGGRLLFVLGGSYPEPATLTKNLRVEAIGGSATLGN
jgi:hypothetical protein